MNQRKRKLQLKEDDGLWIQCCRKNCRKWRFVKEYQDPLSVPETWVCSQNTDKKYSSCKIPEEQGHNDLVESKYISGNLVWAKLKGYPWWPAIIDNSPVTNKFYKLGTSNVPISYHVTFIEEGQKYCNWLKPENIKPFKEDDDIQPSNKSKLIYNDLESLAKSVKTAKFALTLDTEKRLKMYSFYFQSEDSEKKKVTKKRKEYVKYFPTSNKRSTKEAKSLIHSTQGIEDMQIVRRSSILEPNENKNLLFNFQRWNFCSIQ